MKKIIKEKRHSHHPCLGKKKILIFKTLMQLARHVPRLSNHQMLNNVFFSVMNSDFVKSIVLFIKKKNLNTFF